MDLFWFAVGLFVLAAGASSVAYLGYVAVPPWLRRGVYLVAALLALLLLVWFVRGG